MKYVHSRSESGNVYYKRKATFIVSSSKNWGDSANRARTQRS